MPNDAKSENLLDYFMFVIDCKLFCTNLRGEVIEKLEFQVMIHELTYPFLIRSTSALHAIS